MTGLKTLVGFLCLLTFLSIFTSSIYAIERYVKEMRDEQHEIYLMLDHYIFQSRERRKENG